jgi:signal transduction histidine kinase
MKSESLSFAARLSLWFATVVIGLSVALFLTAYFLLYRAVQEQDREVVRAQLEVYRAWYAEGGLQALSSRFFARDDSGKGLFFVRVVGRQGPALFVSIPKQGDPLDLSRLEGMTHDEAFEWLTLPARRDGRGWLVATARLPDGAWLQVGKTTEALSALLSEFRAIFGWAALVALLLGLAGGAWLTRRALAPIRQLTDAVQNVIATGRLNERMPLPEANDEISRLARLFNTMLAKNDTLIRGMREALDNVAHDLRTPLTRLRGTAELAIQGEPDAQKARDALLDTMEESDRVLTMLNTLMDISEAETGLMKLDLQSIPLAELVGEVVELFEFVAEEKHIAVTTTIAPDLHCTADRNRLQQVLVNLLDNALKYTPDGGRVETSAEAHAEEITITVKDTGAGIPAQEIPRIWERLYRGDKSRSQRGLGLGLSLVRAIISAHGGRIECESAVGRGSIFIIYLPEKSVALTRGDSLKVGSPV